MSNDDEALKATNPEEGHEHSHEGANHGDRTHEHREHVHHEHEHHEHEHHEHEHREHEHREHEHHEHHEHGHHDKQHEVTIFVNEQPVKMRAGESNGMEIKNAAIAQGVLIQPNFVLQEELPNGTSRIVGDGDPVHVRADLRFTAIAPDDNS